MFGMSNLNCPVCTNSKTNILKQLSEKHFLYTDSLKIISESCVNQLVEVKVEISPHLHCEFYPTR